MSVIRELFECMQDSGGDFEAGASEQLIQEAERSLSVVFPDPFRQFLATVGCGDYDGREFYGLVPGDPNLEESPAPSLVRATREARENEGLPMGSVVVAEEPDGRPYALACEDGAGVSTGGVGLWNFGTREFDQVERYSDYVEFVSRWGVEQ